MEIKYLPNIDKNSKRMCALSTSENFLKIIHQLDKRPWGRKQNISGVSYFQRWLVIITHAKRHNIMTQRGQYWKKERNSDCFCSIASFVPAPRLCKCLATGQDSVSQYYKSRAKQHGFTLSFSPCDHTVILGDIFNLSVLHIQNWDNYYSNLTELLWGLN